MVRCSAVLVGCLVGVLTSSLGAQEPLLAVGSTAVPDVTAPVAPAPITVRARWAYYLNRTYHPQGLAILALETMMDQGLRQPACWDRSPGSYLLRYSRSFDRRLIRNTAEFGAGLLTGEDLRYQRRGTGPWEGRVWHAVSGAFLAHIADGRERPAYTRFAASTIAEVGTAHWTGQHITGGWLAQATAEDAVDQIETNLLDEFTPDLRRIGKTLRHRLPAAVR